VELCRTHTARIDLMLTDVVMPGIGGRELAVQVAGIRPQMKVLFMSGYADRGVSDQTYLDPGAAFLEKPFTFSTLTQKLRELLGH
jgi:FixJ family two-component response regulator